MKTVQIEECNIIHNTDMYAAIDEADKAAEEGWTFVNLSVDDCFYILMKRTKYVSQREEEGY